MSYDHIFRAAVVRENDRIVTRWFSCDSSLSPWPTLAEAMSRPLQEIPGLCFPADASPETIGAHVESLARDYDGGALREARVTDGPAAYKVWARRFASAGVKLRPPRPSRIVYSPCEVATRGVDFRPTVAAGTPVSEILNAQAAHFLHAGMTMAPQASHPFGAGPLYAAWFRRGADDRIACVALASSPGSKRGIPRVAEQVLFASGHSGVAGRPPLNGMTLADALNLSGPGLRGMRIVFHAQPDGRLFCFGASLPWVTIPCERDPVECWNRCLKLYRQEEAAEIRRRIEEFDPTMVPVELDARAFLAEFVPHLLPAIHSRDSDQLVA